MRNFTVIGISHRKTPVRLRERVAVPAPMLATLLQSLRAAAQGEFVVLSTCNRTEVYFATAGTAAGSHIRQIVFAALDDAAYARLAYTKRGRMALRHLFRVAAGLDAMVFGETEILGQLKQALSAAKSAGTVGRLFNLLFRDALRTAKHIHSQTALSRGRTSVSSLAVKFAEQTFHDLPLRRVLVIGAGEAAEGIAKSLAGRGVSDILVANRSVARGALLAARFHGKALPLADAAAHLSQVDIVLSSTGASDFVITAAAVRQAVAQRGGAPLLLVDLAVPRDIEPDAGAINGVRLYDMDSLRGLANANRIQRAASIRAATAIIRQEVAASAAQAEARLSKYP